MKIPREHKGAAALLAGLAIGVVGCSLALLAAWVTAASGAGYLSYPAIAVVAFCAGLAAGLRARAPEGFGGWAAGAIITMTGCVAVLSTSPQEYMPDSWWIIVWPVGCLLLVLPGSIGYAFGRQGRQTPGPPDS